MKFIGNLFKKAFLWRYERGSWQYDLLCGLILAFIFIGPNQVFHSADGAYSAPLVIQVGEIGGPLATENAEQIISDYLSTRFNRKVKASRIEPMYEDDKLTGYLVKEIKQ
jgi:hypothetical protein